MGLYVNKQNFRLPLLFTLVVSILTGLYMMTGIVPMPNTSVIILNKTMINKNEMPVAEDKNSQRQVTETDQTKDVEAEIVVKKDVQAERQSHLEYVCKTHDIPGNIDKVLVHASTAKSIAYCENHKAASSYWIQVLRFLSGDVRHPVQRPSDISKFDTHLIPFRKIKAFAFTRKLTAIPNHLENSYRFMVARDPYSRLWSVYVDKFVLVDNYFWAFFRTKIKQVSGKTTGYQGSCEDVSFEEFLRYVVAVGKESSSLLDGHMKPVHQGCNPCLFRPHFLGKVETLISEKEQLLRRLGVDEEDKDFNAHVVKEISMISDFEFKLVNEMQLQARCVSPVNLEERLLRTFIINGYLDEESFTYFRSKLPLGKHNFKSQVVKYFLQSERSEKVILDARSKNRQEAYATIPRTLLQELRDIYKYDFLLFEYDPSPEYIFPKQ